MAINFIETITDPLMVAISLVRDAQREIVVSKSSSDVSVPPSEEYYQILNLKIEEGIPVKRYFFGSHDEYLAEKKLSPHIKVLFCADVTQYQRAIILDRSIAMFKAGDVFCKTKNKLLIEALLKYLEDCQS